MTLTGLPLQSLLALAGVAGLLVVVFYILKLRRRPVPVPFSRIWERILRDKEATTLFSRLKRLWSLLLQLVILALLLASLGDPRTDPNAHGGRNLVVLLDASASMQATDAPPSRLETAKREVDRLIQGLGSADRMLIAQMDAGVSPLSIMTGEVATLEAALAKTRSTDTRADLRRAMSFALDALRGLAHPEIVLVSDGALGNVKEELRGLDLGGIEVRFLPVGRSSKNVAITGFSVRRYPLDKSRSEVMLEVTNTNPEPAELELGLLGDGQLVDITRLRLGPKERLPRFYQDLAGASRTLEARIKLVGGPPDDLPADDRAYAVMPERRRARVLVVTAGNTYLEAALLLDEYLDVTTVAPSEYPPRGSYDVTIFDGVAPALAGESGSVIYLGLPAQGGPVKHRREIRMFGFDVWDKKNPILRWMDMGDIQVAEGSTLEPEKEDRVVGASEHGPILVAGRRGGRKFVALGFDPRQSDFVLRVGWPLFLLNTINHFVEEDASYVSSYRTGEVWHIPAPGNTPTAVLRDPEKRERKIPVKEGHAVYFGDRAGFYQLLVNGDSEDRSYFAANLTDPDESRIEPVVKLDLGGKTAAAPVGLVSGVRRELWIYLLLAVIGISLFEWLTYHRRWTV